MALTSFSRSVRRFANQIVSTRITSGEGYFENLDSLRAIAAIFVLVSHVPVFPNNLGRPGVLIFFTLSGFLLYQGLLATLEKYGMGSRQILAYLIRRIFRIVPLYLVFISYYAFIDREWETGHRSDWWLAHALFLVNGDLHLWTLKTEMVFYTALPFLVLILVVIKNVQVRLILLTVMSLCSWYFLEHRGYQHQGWAILMMTGFLLGMLAVHVYQYIPSSIARVFAAISVLWILMVSVFPPISNPIQDMFGIQNVLDINAKHYLIYPVTFLLVCCLCRYQSRFWGNIYLRLIGVCGYGFYLWHIVTSEVLLKHFAPGYAMLITTVLFTFALAFVSYLLIEAPGIKIGKKLSYWILDAKPIARRITPLHAGLVVIAVIAGVRQYYLFDPTYHVNLEAWANQSSVVRVFLRNGCCYSPENSNSSLLPGNTWARLYIPIDEVKLKGFRLDPGPGPREFKFRNITIDFPFANRLHLDPGQFEAFQDINRFSVENGVMTVNVPPGAIDPVVYYRGELPRRWLSTKMAAMLFGLFIFLLLLIGAKLLDRHGRFHKTKFHSERA